MEHIAEAIRVLKKVLDQCLTISKSSSAGAAAFRLGASVNEGWEIRVHEEDVELDGSASNDLSAAIPDGAVILASQGNLKTTVVATTAVKVGIGISGNPDLYGLSADLVKNTKIDSIPDYAVLSGDEDIGVYAADTNGGAAGTLDTGTVRVRIVYAALTSLEDAA
jgi:hypothetical protein